MAALLLTAFVEPLVAYWSARNRIFAGALLFAVNVGILLVVFNQRWERWFGGFGKPSDAIQAMYLLNGLPE